MTTAEAVASGPWIEALYARTDFEARRDADPVHFAHRYELPADRELAAVLASCLAYGRVAGFTPVLARIFALADEHGGPRAWVETFDPEVHGPPLRPIVYRWNRGVDLVLLLAALHDLTTDGRSLEASLPTQGDLVEALDGFVLALRDAAVRAAPSVGLAAARFEDLPRGFRTFLPRPSDGSATKRWWMFLRWMIRPAREGIDLGLWRSRRPAELLVPVDTHVLKLAGFLGLTTRKDGSLATSREITASLRRIDPVDPVRFDFALAHLGISGACRGRRDEAVCPGCTLAPVCVAR